MSYIKNKTAIEGQFANGAIPINLVKRKIRKALRPKLGKGIGEFDWNKGYDVRDIIGPVIIKNQGNNFSCGGQAGSYFLEIQQRLRGIKEGPLSAKSVYSPISFPGGGTTIDMLEKQIGGAGANLETEVLSYDAYGNPLPEYLITDKSWITDTLSISSLARAGYVPYDIPDDIDSVASAIEAYGAVIWEVGGKNNGTWLTAHPIPPSKYNPSPLWHHFMCLVGAKMIDGKKTIIALQSMGVPCGDKGIQYFREDYFTSGYIVDCFTFVSDRNAKPDPLNNSFWANVSRLFRRMWGMAGLVHN
jgi:hypothetical protein